MTSMFYSSHKISRAISSLNPLSNPHQKDSPSTLVPNPPTEVDIASLPVLHLNLMKKNCLFLLKKDGQKGSIFEIKKDLKFGCDHPANIRIKSSSIAKEHAIIQVYDDQNCYLVHLSSSNPPKVNGKKCGKEPLRLNDGDIISMGGRSFLFQSSSSSNDSSHFNLPIDSPDKSFHSQLSVSTLETENEISKEPQYHECGYLYICNRDGTERAPFRITEDVVFGSEPPASIRIKSRSMDPAHAKIMVTSIRDLVSYKLISLTLRNPATVNGVSAPFSEEASEEGGILLSNNDIIEMGGRKFYFRLVLEKRDEDSMSAGSRSDTDGSPHRTSYSEDEKDSIPGRNRFQENVEESKPQPVLTKSTTKTETLHSDDSPTLKPPPRPPTPPAIKFNTMALVGGTLTKTRSSRSNQNLPSLERGDRVNKDRSVSPLTLRSRIRPSNLLFNRGPDSFDISGSDCDSVIEFQETMAAPSPTEVMPLSPKPTKRPTSFFISPPSPYPEQRQLTIETDRECPRIDSLISVSQESPKADNDQPSLDQNLVPSAQSDSHLQDLHDTASQNRVSGDLELNQLSAHEQLPCDTISVPCEFQIGSESHPTTNTSDLDGCHILTEPTPQPTPVFNEVLPACDIHHHEVINPRETTSTLESSLETPNVPSPVDSHPGVVRESHVETSSMSSIHQPSSADQLVSEVVCPPPVRSHPVVITLSQPSHRTPTSIPPIEIPSPSISSTPSTISAVSPPPRQSFFRNIFQPLTSTASTISIHLLSPLLSIVRDFGIGNSTSLSNPNSSSLSSSSSYLGDIEENLSSNMEETTPEVIDESDSLSEAIIKAQGLRSLFNFNVYLLRQAFGTFRGFFFYK